jgi:hypothetical protein
MTTSPRKCAVDCAGHEGFLLTADRRACASAQVGGPARSGNDTRTCRLSAICQGDPEQVADASECHLAVLTSAPVTTYAVLKSVAAGAKALVSEDGFEIAKEGTNYVQPQGDRPFVPP